MTKDEYKQEIEKHIVEVKGLLLIAIKELLKKANRHDASKLQSPEIDLFSKYIPELAKIQYGSKQYKQALKKLRPALDHHYAKNAHHPNHYVKGIKGMNLFDLVEMICDWISSAKRHQTGDVKQSIILNQKRFGYSDDLKLILFNTLKVLK